VYILQAVSLNLYAPSSIHGSILQWLVLVLGMQMHFLTRHLCWHLLRGCLPMDPMSAMIIDVANSLIMDLVTSLIWDFLNASSMGSLSALIIDILTACPHTS